MWTGLDPDFAASGAGRALKSFRASSLVASRMFDADEQEDADSVHRSTPPLARRAF